MRSPSSAVTSCVASHSFTKVCVPRFPLRTWGWSAFPGCRLSLSPGKAGFWRSRACLDREKLTAAAPRRRSCVIRDPSSELRLCRSEPSHGHLGWFLGYLSHQGLATPQALCSLLSMLTAPRPAQLLPGGPAGGNLSLLSQALGLGRNVGRQVAQEGSGGGQAQNAIAEGLSLLHPQEPSLKSSGLSGEL